MNFDNLIEPSTNEDYEIMMMRFFLKYLKRHNKKIFSQKIILAQINLFVEDLCQYCQGGEINDLIFVVVMRGAEPFANEFIERLKKVQPSFNKPKLCLLRCSSYKGDTQSSGKVEIEFMQSDNPASLLKPNSKVVILEDIIETGNTLNQLCETLTDLYKVKIIKFFALIDKSKGKSFNSSIPVVRGLQYDGNLFLYGYGPDLNCTLRYISEIWGISKDQYQRIFTLIEPIRLRSQSRN